ncbi:hypothetical protein B0O80DRAFT_3582 [Mortierella sp. GBAus27b]|nr:hypothetical protein B0O80DRAFT_3582 [Mortierella sp. GBAus27b]
MILGWALLVFAAIKLVSLAVSYLLTLSPLQSSGVDMHQDQQQHFGSAHGGAPLRRLTKRDLGEDDRVVLRPTTTDSTDSKMVLVPIVPGITLPLSHLPYYLVALLVSGVFHEAGHALAAAREGTKVSSTGIFLYILYPGAFVDIESRDLVILSSLQQLRIICAGVWHNISMFVAAWIFLASGALHLSFRVAGWREMNDGLSVVDIAPPSPLYGMLKPGIIINRLNDVPLRGDPLSVWSKALLEEDVSATQDAGFCIPNTLLFTKPSDCCLFTPKMPFGHSRDRLLSCFTLYDTSNGATRPQEYMGDQVLARNGQCLSSFDVLADPNPRRCTPHGPTCGASGTCYRPFSAYNAGSIVRIYYTTPRWMDSSGAADQKAGSLVGEQVILYQGSPRDIWETVQVTTMSSRWSFLPLWFPNAVLLTIRYTMSFSLALSLLNIVPARHLDGQHALEASVALFRSIRQTYLATHSIRDSLRECLLLDGESATAAASYAAASTKGLKSVRGVVLSTTILLGGVMIGSLIQMVAVML